MSKIEHNGTPGYFVENQSSKMGLILMQEWWGVDDNILEYAKKFGTDFKVVVPDLYRGRVTQDPDEASHLMNGLDFKNAVKDVKQLAAFLKSKGATKIGVVGYCMGGALTIASAVDLPDVLHAGSCYYGIPPAQYFDYKTLKIPMQFHFGKDDTSEGFSDPKTYLKMKKELEEQKIDTSEFYAYDGCQHAFMNTHETAYPYHPDAAKTAHERTVKFFKKKLQ